MKQSRSAFSVVELIVAVGIIITLSAMSFAGVQTLTTRASATKCANNLRQLGAGAMLYAADNNMCLPVTVHQRSAGGKSWTLTLREYLGGRAPEGRDTGPTPVVFTCPSDELSRTYTYTINDFLTPNPSGAPDLDHSRLITVSTASQTILFGEAARTFLDSDHFHFASYRGAQVPPAVVRQQIGVTRHSGKANYVFADGHLETLGWEEVQQRLAQSNSCFIEPNRQ